MSAGAAANVGAVRRFIQLTNAGQREQALAWLLRAAHPSLEFTTAVGGAIDGRLQHGPEEARRYFSDLFETFDELRYDDAEFLTVGEQVVMLARVVGRGHESGAAVELELGLVCGFEDGLIRRAISYTSHADAMTAAEELLA